MAGQHARDPRLGHRVADITEVPPRQQVAVPDPEQDLTRTLGDAGGEFGIGEAWNRGGRTRNSRSASTN